MTQNFTSIEQSKKLLEIGISPESADMHYFDWTKDKTIPCIGKISENVVKNKRWLCIPCWSLTALLELIPDTISDDSFPLYPIHRFNLWISRNYCCYFRVEEDGTVCISHEEKCSTTIDAAFEMVIWLKEQNYI